MPAPISESANMTFRSHLSMSVPANGLNITPGKKVITPTRIRPVAVPVKSQAQSVIANWVMRVAKMEMNCPNHIM